MNLPKPTVISNAFLADARAARKELGCSQGSLARDLCVSEQTVYTWERGRIRTEISFENAVKLAAALGLDLNKYKEHVV